MDKRRVRRICRALYFVAIALNVIAIFGIIGSVLCIAHGRMEAVLLLAVCIGLVWLGSELAEATDKRIH